jgi:hypothetical protein
MLRTTLTPGSSPPRNEMNAPHRSWADLPHRLREQLIDLRRGYRQFWADLKDDPGRVWRNPFARLLAWATLGVAAVLLVNLLVGRFVIPPQTSAEQATSTATLYVACTNPACRAAGVIERPLNFSAWPAKCDKCGASSVYRATVCPKCGRWFALTPDQPPGCPFCAEASQPRTRPTGPPRSTDPNNLEDDW